MVTVLPVMRVHLVQKYHGLHFMLIVVGDLFDIILL